MSPVFVKTVGSAVVAILSALVVGNTFPAVTGLLGVAAGLITGWLHLPQPGAK